MLELTFVLQSKYNKQNSAWIVSEWVLRLTCSQDNPKNLSPDPELQRSSGVYTSSGPEFIIHAVTLLQTDWCSGNCRQMPAMRLCKEDSGTISIFRDNVIYTLTFAPAFIIFFNWHKELPTTIQGRVTWPARKDCKVQWVTVGVKGGP